MACSQSWESRLHASISHTLFGLHLSSMTAQLSIPATPSSSLLHSSHSPLHFSTPHYHSPFKLQHASTRTCLYQSLMELNTVIAHTSLIIYSMPFTLIIFVTLRTQGCDHAKFLLCNTYCKTSHWLRCLCPSFSLYSYKTSEHFTIFKLRSISILHSRRFIVSHLCESTC